MKKRIWILAWILCLSTAFGLYIFTALTEAAKPPVAGWSRPLTLVSQEGLSAYDLRNSEGIAVITESDGAGILYQGQGKGLLKLEVAVNGNVSAVQVLDPNFKPADRLQVYRGEEGWLLAALQERRINVYRIGKVSAEFLYSLKQEDVKRFDNYKGKYALIAESGLYVGDQNGMNFAGDSFQLAKWVPKTASQLCTVLEQDGRKLLQFRNMGEQQTVLAQWTLPADAQTAVEAVVPYGDDGTLGALVELKDFKTGMVRLADYRVKPVKQEREVLSSNGDLNPVILKMENGLLNLLVTREQQKGDDQAVWNLRQMEWDGTALAEKSFITQTDARSVPMYGWNAGRYRYVLSADLSGDTKTLMLSGNAPELVQKTASLSRKELTNLLPSVMMTLLPALMVGLFPCVYILVPIMLVLFLISFFRLSWAEANAGRLVLFSIGGHIALKVFFAFRWVLLNNNIPDISAQLPLYLNTTAAMLITLCVSTGAAWLTARLRSPEKAMGDFWGPYGEFAIIDISIFILLVMPYYYAYVGLPVFIR